MPRLLCLFLWLPSLAFCQTLNQTWESRASNQGLWPSSPVQVVYTVDNSTLTTYNIDPQTFQPSVVGTTAMPKSKYPRIISSPTGQFLYYFADSTFNNQGQIIYVYDTDSNGVPGNTPVQSIKAGQLYYFLVNPSSTFSYSVAVGPAGPQTTPYSIVRNVVNPANGALSQPVTEATYVLDNDVSGDDCGLEILGFSPAGTELYDEINCSSPHGSGSETFNQRTVDLQTGALGPDVQIFAFSYYAASGYANVQFANNLAFAFQSFYVQGPNANIVDIYQTQPYSPTPLVNCTTTMAAICGDFTIALVHPSGEYAFLGTTSNPTDILRVDLTTQQLVPVGTLPSVVEKLSPDGSVIYGYNPAPKYIHIAGFNVANGQVTLGGTITLTNAVNDFWTTAERD